MSLDELESRFRTIVPGRVQPRDLGAWLGCARSPAKLDNVEPLFALRLAR
jgi:hypothetical protein